MKLKQNGIILLTFTLLSSVLLIITGLKFFFILLSLSIITLLVGFVSISITAVTFSYLHKIESDSCIKGKSQTLTIEVHNDWPFVYPSIQMIYTTLDSVINDKNKSKCITLLPFSSASIYEKFNCHIKGCYYIGLIGVVIEDLFNLISIRIDLTKKHYYKAVRLNILPRVLDIKNPIISLPDYSGLMTKKLKSTDQPSSLSDVRDYIYGDSFKRIHWKLSSKYQEIKIKKYENDSEPGVVLLMETFKLPYDKPIRLDIEDQIIEISIALINNILKQELHLQVTTITNSVSIIQGKQSKDFSKLYNYITNIDFTSNMDMSNVISFNLELLLSTKSVIIVCHTINSKLFNYLCMLAENAIKPQLFIIQHRDIFSINTDEMILELNSRHIPTYKIFTDQRLDKVLEASLNETKNI